MLTTPTQVCVPLPLLEAPTPLYKDPLGQESDIRDRQETEEIILRIHTPAPLEMVGMEGSMHRLIMLDPMVLPQQFEDNKLRGHQSSIHNLNNRMQEHADFSPREVIIDATHPSNKGEWGDSRDMSKASLELVAAVYGGTLTPEFESLVVVIQGMLALLQDDISMLSARLDKREHGNPSPNNSTPPAGPARITKSKPPTMPKPSSILAQAPKAPPPPARRGWDRSAEMGININEKAVHQQAHTAQIASEAASAQGCTPVGNPRQGAPQLQVTQTEVTIVRHGGFEDAEHESMLRRQAMQSIVLDVCTALERNMENPIKVLGGRWSSVVEKMGNFTFILTGDVREDAINVAKSYLCGPFPDVEVIPNAGWVWTQL